ncbi:MAG: cysteine desulfurase [Zoogloeaceae bacterium]|jgi:cysteine desulfurase|nr:cysteine desulfurase [Zoogloeaceae bacterium]
MPAVYLDHNATTPLAAPVLEAMLPFLARSGNPSSLHTPGRAAHAALFYAREQVARAVDAEPAEIIFVSGGSEANNLFLKGTAACCAQASVLATSAIEHASVKNPARQLVRCGWQHLELPVDTAGRVRASAVEAALAEGATLWSVLRAHNETGVLQDVAGLAEQVRARAPAARFHVDAAQAFGKIPLSFRALNRAGVHALTLSAHKMGGPLGAAALVVDKRLELEPLIAGGGQERGLRSGTENIAAIAGFGAAAEWAARTLSERAQRLAALREKLESGLRAQGATIFGEDVERLPNTVFFAFPNLDGETLVGQMDRAGFALGSGSACSSARPEISPTLTAMRVSEALARGAARVSLGNDNTADEIDAFLLALARVLTQFKTLTALNV